MGYAFGLSTADLSAFLLAFFGFPTVNQSRPIGRPRGFKRALGKWSGGGLIRLASALSLLALWVILSLLLSENVVPGPLATLGFLGHEIARGALFFNLWMTFKRVVIAFVIAMLLGISLGVASGASQRWERVISPWLTVGLTIPRIVLFVIAYLLLGLTDFAAIVALVLSAVPTIIVQMREGTQALDGKLLEMARAYRRPPLSIWRQVVFPQLLPYFIGTARGALSLAWKMVVLAELLGRTNGVGYEIYFYFQLFNMKGVLAYGLAMMIILALVDLAFVMLMRRATFRWRRTVDFAL
jgi:NitT/TauT family transport system permease protein